MVAYSSDFLGGRSGRKNPGCLTAHYARTLHALRCWLGGEGLTLHWDHRSASIYKANEYYCALSIRNLLYGHQRRPHFSGSRQDR